MPFDELPLISQTALVRILSTFKDDPEMLTQHLSEELYKAIVDGHIDPHDPIPELINTVLA